MSTFKFKILNILILFFIVQASFSFAQTKDIIIEDNWDQTTDKLAHTTTSFGLYYTLRYFEFSKFESLLASTIIGFSYEVYQINDPRESDSDFRGISIQDMGYNVFGILCAYGFDQAISIARSSFQKDRPVRNRTSPK